LVIVVSVAVVRIDTHVLARTADVVALLKRPAAGLILIDIDVLNRGPIIHGFGGSRRRWRHGSGSRLELRQLRQSDHEAVHIRKELAVLPIEPRDGSDQREDKGAQ
jgi:hypothetical protein